MYQKSQMYASKKPYFCTSVFLWHKYKNCAMLLLRFKNKN
ncbi:hypothetical protein HMPREF9193_00909 [Treponema lecithinolyticum ATCC 700332]|uniref:Uncharacterized protein n=1 Tax=Treponema lecithinolyticum ATCC 700332 TaxID=1321815 RepID=A0ABN0NZE9_TRELE|nr:hypothetical protein HMPREF9193_00909 [Treponema lecithinolyticum ATCC 700332]